MKPNTVTYAGFVFNPQKTVCQTRCRKLAKWGMNNEDWTEIDTGVKYHSDMPPWKSEKMLLSTDRKASPPTTWRSNGWWKHPPCSELKYSVQFETVLPHLWCSCFFCFCYLEDSFMGIFMNVFKHIKYWFNWVAALHVDMRIQCLRKHPVMERTKCLSILNSWLNVCHSTVYMKYLINPKKYTCPIIIQLFYKCGDKTTLRCYRRPI